MIIISGKIDVPGHRVTELLPAARAMVEATRKEAGCIVYSFSIDVIDPAILRIYEEWESQAHLDAHSQQPHMAVWRKAMTDIGATGLVVTAYEAGPGRAL